jgi:hypothetical protein
MLVFPVLEELGVYLNRKEREFKRNIYEEKERKVNKERNYNIASRECEFFIVIIIK